MNDKDGLPEQMDLPEVRYCAVYFAIFMLLTILAGIGVGYLKAWLMSQIGG